MADSYLTDITFDDADAQRVTLPANAGGPTALAQTAAAGPGVVLTATGGVVLYTLSIAANAQNVNIYNLFVLTYGVPPSDVHLEVTVEAGIIVSSLSNNAAIIWGNSWTGTPSFTLINLGSIIGRGGAGGIGADGGSSTNGGNGGDGKNALELSGQTVTITNAAGFIFGGGGGGGGGGTAEVENAAFQFAFSGGGGGAAGCGRISGPGLAGAYSAIEPPWVLNQASSAGSNAATPDQAGPIAAGVGANYTTSGGLFAQGGDGGGSADFAVAGTNGVTATGVSAHGSTLSDGGIGGNPGKAINLTGGTATFASGNNPTHVKGAVS